MYFTIRAKVKEEGEEQDREKDDGLRFVFSTRKNSTGVFPVCVSICVVGVLNKTSAKFNNKVVKLLD